MICWIEFPEWSGIQSSTTNQNKFRIAWLRLNYRLNSFWSQLQLDWNHSLRAKPHSDFKIKPDFRNEWPVIKLMHYSYSPIKYWNHAIQHCLNILIVSNYCYNNNSLAALIKSGNKSRNEFKLNWMSSVSIFIHGWFRID